MCLDGKISELESTVKAQKGIGAVYDLQAVLRSMLNQESRVREIGQTLLSLKSSSPRHCITSSKDFADIC
ncbi:hypothetical protein L3Y34_010588 [Caenorhabditis briggsae]|uniref:Uncharacterized protein n=1 Tax=Caenorhabditis briggsae TaxID=6238 RepID=A0AAE8ZQE3_CAEBR|nr:hypothetical protein L3Y34_010588 [Caenorhabditis briggsae]